MKKTRGKRRNHDGFFKYVYSVPANARALLELCSKSNKHLRNMLKEIDLGSLEEIPEAYNEVGEHGEADLAFKVKGARGEDVFFGMLLEHKSSPNEDILSQIYRYTFEVMVNKNNTEFAWLPTKAIIIYNGVDDWDPLAKFRRKDRAKFQGKDLPFECVLVNLSNVLDKDIASAKNPEAAIGALTMKYAFNAKAFESKLHLLEKLLGRMSNSMRSLIMKKIKLYLGEFISKEAIMELEKEFVSIGQRLGFVSAGDERRKLEAKVTSLTKANSSMAKQITALKAALAKAQQR